MVVLQTWEFITSTVQMFLATGFIANLYSLLEHCMKNEKSQAKGCFVIRCKNYEYPFSVFERIKKANTGVLDWSSYRKDKSTGMLKRETIVERRRDDPATVENVFMSG